MREAGKNMNYLNEKPLVTSYKTNWNSYVQRYMQNDLSTSSNDYMYIFNDLGITTYKLKEKIKKQPRGNKSGVAHLRHWRKSGTLKRKI